MYTAKRAVLSGLVVAISWEGVARLSGVDPVLLPYPTHVMRAVLLNWDHFTHHALLTTRTAAMGLGIGITLALITASLMTGSRVARYLVEPWLVVSQTFPAIAIAPLLFIWLGYGLTSKVAVTALVCFFPLAINMVRGMVSLPRSIAEPLSCLGLSRWEELVYFRFPHSLPMAAAGLRIAGTYSVLGATIAEFLLPDQGLGRVIIMAQRNYRVEMIFAALMLLATIGVCFFGLASLVEARIRRTFGRTEEVEK